MEVITIQTEAFKVLLEKIDRIDRKFDSYIQKPELKDKWFDIQEACFLLKVSKRTLSNYRRDGILPYSKVDGKIYFKASDLQRLLEKNYKKIRR